MSNWEKFLSLNFPEVCGFSSSTLEAKDSQITRHAETMEGAVSSSAKSGEMWAKPVAFWMIRGVAMIYQHQNVRPFVNELNEMIFASIESQRSSGVVVDVGIQSFRGPIAVVINNQCQP